MESHMDTVESNMDIIKMFKLQQFIWLSNYSGAYIVSPKMNQCVKDICTSVFATALLTKVKK